MSNATGILYPRGPTCPLFWAPAGGKPDTLSWGPGHPSLPWLRLPQYSDGTVYQHISQNYDNHDRKGLDNLRAGDRMPPHLHQICQLKFSGKTFRNGEESVMEPIVNAPVILDLGKTKKKNIKRLKRGQGKLVGDVQDAMREVTASLGDQADGKQLIPVVLVYRKKSRGRRRGGGGFFPLLPFA